MKTMAMPTPSALDHADIVTKERASVIKYGLSLAGYTQADIAREFKKGRATISRSTVSMVINGRGRSRKIELRIAAILQMPPADLWPQWHGVKPPRRGRTSNSQIAEAIRALAG
jgi:lambda repressor-like predicted transcriptional regulator